MIEPGIDPPTPVSTAKGVLAGLAADLSAVEGVGYAVGPVAELLGPVAQRALGRDEVLPAAIATAGDSAGPLATLTRLWVLGLPVPRGHLDVALPRTGTAGAAVLGLVAAAGAGEHDEVAPLVELNPHAADEDEWWLASDLTHTGRPLRPDHVLGVGGASTTLARWTPRGRVGSALDIGTGCGVQAFHLAAHARAVTATDTSTRCLAFAAFNAGLNAAAAGGPFAGRALDLREGSLLYPVAGEHYDLVVSNPPYVITPRGAGAATPTYTYRDAGLPGDDVVRRLVEGVGAVLTPGGTAQLLGNWEHRRGEDWRERLGGWLDASGLHGWVVQREVQDPAEYAETWARDGGQHSGSREARSMYADWLLDFERRGVEGVGFGIITLRRPVGAVVGVGGHGPAALIRRIEELSGPTAEAMGATVAAVLDAEVWLLEVGDRELLETRLVLAPDVTEERYGRPGAADPEVILLQQGGGLRRSVRADTALAGVVGACDGDLALGPLVGAVARLIDEPVAALQARILPAVRRLVADGLLIRA